MGTEQNTEQAPSETEPPVLRRETFPIAPPDEEDTVLEIPGAILSPFSKGDLRTLRAPFHWTRGAVYDAAGSLLEASQRIGGLGGDRVVAADPATFRQGGRRRFPVPLTHRRERRLAGTWLYAGPWMNQFGHFITETLTTLWPTDVEVVGIAAHPFFFGGGESDWQLELLELAGYGSLPRVHARDSIRVERLLVPTRPFVTNGYATSSAVRTWQRVAEAATAGPAQGRAVGAVFLSRTHWHARERQLGRQTPRALQNEELLDQVMESRGYRVIFPEELGVREQISTAQAAETLLGVSGSALHLSAFARSGTRVIEICDPRSGISRLPNQRVIDAACGHLAGVLPFTGDEQGVDIGRLEASLDQAGI